ncbi:putative AC transposase [Senna tora]|uniref:Putative AC transposase n=1 Tax=Senna tora TaxID=362788 RepID=A0A835CJI9_9FABA|nr:putative AC transposase [Senna tora]
MIRFLYVPTPLTMDVLANTLPEVAVILDPRYKLKVIEYSFPKIYKDQSSHYIEEVRNIMSELLQEYHANPNTDESSPHISASTSESVLNLIGEKGIDEESGMANLVQFLTSSSSSSIVKSELDHYFEEPTLPWSPNFDILNIGGKQMGSNIRHYKQLLETFWLFQFPLWLMNQLLALVEEL